MDKVKLPIRLQNYLDDALKSDLHKAQRILATHSDLDVSNTEKKIIVKVTSESSRAPYAIQLKKLNGESLTRSAIAPSIRKKYDCKHAVAATLFIISFIKQGCENEEEVIAEQAPDHHQSSLSTNLGRQPGRFVQ